jgi:quercetin dioxygenase-like cupin family protein
MQWLSRNKIRGCSALAISRNDRLSSGSAQSPVEGDEVMVNIQYFVDKVKGERDAAAGPSAGENPICACNGEVGVRPRVSHSISKFASVVNAGCGVAFNLGGPRFELLASAEESAYWMMKGTLPAHVSVPLHSQGDAERFYLIPGEAQFLAPTTSGLQWKTLRPGDFVHIPSDVKRAWRNLSRIRLRSFVPQHRG